MKGALLLLASAPLVAAMCPNSCSGQGECGDYDACTCYANYRGADCSQRICPYAPAWVTTAKGDLNFDGDRVDYTVYNVDSKIADGFETFITQEFVGGDWESWPSHAEAGEGHFYMECANRGLCDRELGECACFPGYEGSACQRMVCPNDCSGKGTCQSTSYLTANPSDVLTDWYDTVATANPAYAMWDGTMAMSCKCDPGYSGPDCSVRMCPVGDDPVTITNQIYETQFVDIFTPCEGTKSGATTTNCPAAAATTTIGGSVTLTFTDHFGEEHTTAPIDGLVAYNGGDTAFAAAAQAALRALPNRAVSNTLTVHSMFCEYLEPSETVVADGVATVGGTTTTHAIRALAGTGCVAAMGNSVYAVDGKVKVVGSSTGSAAVGTKEAAGASADCTVGDVSIVETPLCHRLVVNFDGMPGNHHNLKVDVSEATHGGKTNAQDAGSYMQSTVTSRLKIAGATVELGYTAPGSITVTDDDGYLDATTTQTDIKLDITATGNVINQAVANTFPTSSRVKVECGGDAGTTYRNLGVYTVLSATANILSIAEVIPASTIHDDCGTGANGHYIKLTMVSHIVTTGADATTADGAATDTSVDAGLILPSIQGPSGVRVGIGIDITAGASYVLNSHYSSSDHSATLSDAATAQKGSIIMYSEATVSNGKNAHQTGGNAATAGTILGSNTAATAAAITATVLSTAAAGTLHVEGDGTHESVECGARGLCDTEAGECKCFAGYTGLSCGSQNALQL